MTLEQLRHIGDWLPFPQWRDHVAKRDAAWDLCGNIAGDTWA